MNTSNRDLLIKERDRLYDDLIELSETYCRARRCIFKKLPLDDYYRRNVEFPYLRRISEIERTLGMK